LTGLVVENAPHEAADGLGRAVVGCGADEVREPLFAEEFPVRGAGLGDAVGAEQ
jgi:hypothetical protein